MTTSHNSPSTEDDGFLGSEPELESAYVEQAEALWSIADSIGLDVAKRRFVWPDGSRLTLDESVDHLLRQHPDFSEDQVEDFLISFIENYAPEEYSEAQLDELDHLAEEWLDEIEDAHEEE